jgi:hypothetical protein
MQLTPSNILYRRLEILRMSQERFGAMLGRSRICVFAWESGTHAIPPYLGEWLDYAEGELICGRIPIKMPRAARDVWAFLRPTEHARRMAELEARKARGKARREAHQRAKEHMERRQCQALNQARLEAAKAAGKPAQLERLAKSTDEKLREMASAAQKLYLTIKTS